MATATLGSNPVANMQALDTLTRAGGEVALPAGEFTFTATPERRYAAILTNTLIRSQGRTLLRLGPDSVATPGFDSTEKDWALFKAELGNYRVEMLPGIEMQGPNITPQLLLDGRPKSIPRAFISQGSGLGASSPSKREFIFHDFIARGCWHEGLLIGSDLNPAPAGTRTIVRIDRAEIESYANGIAMFGDTQGDNRREITIRNLKMLCGWELGGAGYGNGLYIPQGCSLILDGFDITHRHGRDCIKYAGTNSEGRGRHSYIANGVCRTLTPGSGARGIGMDTAANCPVSNVFFDSSLDMALQIAGKADVRGGAVECKRVFGGMGDLTGGSPIIMLQGVRLDGIDTVWDFAMENATVVVDSCPITTDKKNFLFALPVAEGRNIRAQTMRMRIRNCPIQADDVEAVFAPRAGDWEIESCDVRARNARMGIFYMGAETGSSVCVRSGLWEGPFYYHGAKQADKDRMKFVE